MRSSLLSASFVATSLFLGTTAFADDVVVGAAAALPPLPAPSAAAPAAPAPPAGPTTKVEAAPGTGLTVVAPLAGGGTVTAVGCSSVVVNNHATEVKPGGPAVAAGAPCPAPAAVQPPPEEKPRYAKDGGRRAAIITAPIVYGIGAAVTGIAYLGAKSSCEFRQYEAVGSGYSYRRSSDCSDATAYLIAYGAISTGVPSIPRLVVGDTGRGILYSALRGGSILTAAFVDWGDSNEVLGPFMFGFAAPVTLAIVDMATTPHREDLVDPADKTNKKSSAEEAKANRPRITSISPVALNDRESKSRGAGFALAGQF